MKARELVLVIVMSLCVSLAIGSGFYLVAGGPASAIAMATATFATAFAQALIFGSQLFHASTTKEKFRDVEANLILRERNDAENKKQSGFILEQLNQLRREASSSAALVAQGFTDLKSSYSGLALELQTRVSNSAKPSAPAEVSSRFEMPAFRPIPPKNANANQAPSAAFEDQLLVSLEPIVDLNTGGTAHYRIHLGMNSESGVELSHDALLAHADHMGLRTQLDIFVGREASALLRRLRLRDNSMLMFMPIGAATLASPETLAQMLSDRNKHAASETGLVYELPHAVLAGLSDLALEGLATLARHGVLLALSNVSTSGLDLQVLASLNVRYVGLDMGALGPLGKPNQSIISFAQTARINRVNIIITGVTNPQLVPSMIPVSRLACGPCFATPRRVKRDIVHEVARSFNAAA